MTTVRRGSTATGKMVWGTSQPIALVNLNAPAPVPPPVVTPPPVDPPPKPPLTPPVTPVPPVKPPMATLTLRANNGQYVCAELDGTINANRDAIGPWETFMIEPTDSGKVALKSAHGKYVCAEGGGGGPLLANRDAIGGWEKFRIVNVGIGFALETDNGHFWCAEEGGGREVNTTRTAIGAWETFNGPSTNLVGDSLRGRLRTDGKLFRASDGGRFVWRFASGFALAHLYATDRPKADAYLDWVRGTGFNGVRVLVGNLAWAGQTFSTALQGLPALLEATASRGLYVELTALSDTKPVSQAQGEGHVLAVAVLASQAENAVLELGNEIGHATQAGWLTQGWAKSFGTRLPASLPWAVGAPVRQDEALLGGTYPGSGGTYITSHLDRGRPFWDQVRRVRELMGLKDQFRVPCVNNEPIGAGPVQQNGRRETNPVFFRALGALNSLMGVQGVFHLDAGLKCSLPSQVETDCGRAFLEGHSVMGDEAGTLQYQNAGFSASPVKSIQNLTRAYSFIGGSSGYTIALGQTPASRIEWQGGWGVTDTVLSGGGLTVWRVGT